MKVWVPKNIIEPQSEIALPVAMQGRYRLEALGRFGRRRDSGWFENLILDHGMNRIADNPESHTLCVVGTGSTPPNAANTALENFLASTINIDSTVRSTAAVSPYGAKKTFTYLFGEGVAQGNITEVGVGWAPADIFSRALIVDGVGSPTTFTVQSDEFLLVTYELTIFPPLVDVVDTIDISGVSTNIVLRASNVDSSNGWQTSSITEDSIDYGKGGSSASQFAYDGPIGAIEGAPTGSFSVASSLAASAYVAGSFQRDYTVTWGLSQGNLGGIQSVETEMSSSGRMRFQCSYDPVIDKDSTKILALTFRQSVARTP